MKKIVFLSIVFAGFATAALAQTDRIIKAPDTTGMKMRSQPGGGRMRQQNMQMIKDLDLTPEQQKQLKASMEDMRTKMDDLRDNTILTPEQKGDQIKALRNEQQTKMASLLTPEQKVKWQAMRKTMMAERMKEPDMGNAPKDSYDNVTREKGLKAPNVSPADINNKKEPQ